MSEEKKLPRVKQVKTVIVGDENLPTHYVNSVNIRAGFEEFFFTFGTALPLEVSDLKDLENVDSINAHALFRCAMTKPMMKQLIDLMTNLYEGQQGQSEQLQISPRKDEEHGDSDNRYS
jgi:hypothetical protein